MKVPAGPILTSGMEANLGLVGKIVPGIAIHEVHTKRSNLYLPREAKKLSVPMIIGITSLLNADAFVMKLVG